MWIPEAYPQTLIVAVPRQGISWIGLASIDSVHAEHETEAR